jgi:hypothetical protein
MAVVSAIPQRLCRPTDAKIASIATRLIVSEHRPTAKNIALKQKASGDSGFIKPVKSLSYWPRHGLAYCPSCGYIGQSSFRPNDLATQRQKRA